MKYLLFLLLIFCAACTKPEIEQPPNKITVNTGSAKILNKKPLKPIDTIIVKKPYTLHDADGNIYDSVIIGSQVWILENLKTTKYNDGSPISNITDNGVWKVLLTPGMCSYNNGALYNWYAVNTGKLCPTGWHVPSDNDWKTLELFLGMNPNEADSTAWRGSGIATILESNIFKGIFTGFRSGWYSTYDDYGQGVYWWSSTAIDGTTAYARTLFVNYPGIYLSLIHI